MKAIRASAAALAIAISSVGAAGAQDQPQQAPWSGPMMGTWGPGGMMGYGMMGYGNMGPWLMGRGGANPAACTGMVGHIDGRLAYIKAELKITATQEPLWETYASAARDNANTMLAHCTAMMSQRGTSTVSLPDRLDQHEQFMAAQLDVVRAMNKALKPLYAALSDSQKKSADQLFWGPMGMM
jgi:LTXXQ motif family protein